MHNSSGQGRAPVPKELLAFARTLRQQQSDAEGMLWQLLRDRRLGGFKFRRQHPWPPFVLDFYCHEARLTVELDGGQHNTEEVRQYDARRDQCLQRANIRVLRFWNHEVLAETEVVLEKIWRILHSNEEET